MEPKMILDVPRDILVHHIFPFLDLEDVANIQITCKRLYTIVQEDTLWKNLILKMHHAENFKSAARFLKEVMNQNAKLEDTIDDQFHQLSRKTKIIKRLEEDLETMWAKLDTQEQNNRNLEARLRCREEELKWLSEHLSELEQSKKAAAVAEARLKEENNEITRKLEECEMEKKKLERTMAKKESEMKDLEDEVTEMRTRMKEIIKHNRHLMLQLQKFRQPTEKDLNTTPVSSSPSSTLTLYPASMLQASPPKDIPLQKPSSHFPTHIHRVAVPTSTSPPAISSNPSPLQRISQNSSPPLQSPPKTVSPPPSRPVYSQLPLNKY